MVVEGGISDCSVARRSEPRGGESHERARPPRWKLGLASQRRNAVRFIIRMAAEFDRDLEALLCDCGLSRGEFRTRINAGCDVSSLDGIVLMRRSPDHSLNVRPRDLQTASAGHLSPARLP